VPVTTWLTAVALVTPVRLTTPLSVGLVVSGVMVSTDFGGAPVVASGQEEWPKWRLRCHESDACTAERSTENMLPIACCAEYAGRQVDGIALWKELKAGVVADRARGAPGVGDGRIAGEISANAGNRNGHARRTAGSGKRVGAPSDVDVYRRRECWCERQPSAALSTM